MAYEATQTHWAQPPAMASDGTTLGAMMAGAPWSSLAQYRGLRFSVLNANTIGILAAQDVDGTTGDSPFQVGLSDGHANNAPNTTIGNNQVTMTSGALDNDEAIILSKKWGAWDRDTEAWFYAKFAITDPSVHYTIGGLYGHGPNGSPFEVGQAGVVNNSIRGIGFKVERANPITTLTWVVNREVVQHSEVMTLETPVAGSTTPNLEIAIHVVGLGQAVCYCNGQKIFVDMAPTFDPDSPGKDLTSQVPGMILGTQNEGTTAAVVTFDQMFGGLAKKRLGG